MTPPRSSLPPSYLKQVPHVPLPAGHADSETIQSLCFEIEKLSKGWVNFALEVPRRLREALDEVIDTPRTGRFTLSQLEKTEKTYIGTKVEILVRDSSAFRRAY